MLLNVNSGDRIKENEMGGACGMYGRCIEVAGTESEGKGPLGRHRLIWNDNIKRTLKNAVGRAWTGLIWLR
jgi:hypothetical protein